MTLTRQRHTDPQRVRLAIGSLLGFLAVFGIATRSLVMLVRHFQDLEREEGEALGPELVRHGARDRLGPILTTTFALALAALPFLVLGSRPGLEVVQPMAVVILGGLVTSTLLTLFVVPALYLRFATPQAEVSPEADLLHRWVGVEPAAAGAPATVNEPVTADGDGHVEAPVKTGESESGEREPAV